MFSFDNESRFSAFLPDADAYAALLGEGSANSCRETDHPYRSGFAWTERHLQCLWFDSRYRPTAFPLPGGETVEVLDPGEWNLEAGPDFLDATLRINPGNRHLRGDIEVHVRPTDWDSHHHANDSRYERVIAHVTWFSAPAARTLPTHIIQLPLAERMAFRPDISLDDIDLKAYPHAVLPETPRPCEPLLHGRMDEAAYLLASAGQYRLRTKAARIAHRLLQLGDRDQVFYEEVMAALGYKYNQGPFRAIAKILPFSEILALTKETLYARFLGCGKLLPQPDVCPDEEGKLWIRSLWDRWFHESCETIPDEVQWHSNNLRPQNAPARRLAAAACLFSGNPTLLEAIDSFRDEQGERWQSLALDTIVERCDWEFFRHRLAFSSQPNKEQHNALLGEARAAAIVTNIVLPLSVAEGWLPPHAIDHIPPEDLSSPMKRVALHLFGRDHNPALYATNGLYQQGLLQIHLDFCLMAKPDCEGCPLVQALYDRL